jgi:type I restriction enzyme R subunit
MKFNEDARVKIPSLIHLTRLGYTYLSIRGAKWDNDTNIFTDVFAKSIRKINEDSELSDVDINNLLKDISLELENDDLGKEFFKRLAAKSGIRLIDFADFDNNSFHVVTELPYVNDDENFRPDIILLINGMPLGFYRGKETQ